MKNPDIRPVLEQYGFLVPTGHGWRRMRCVEHDDRNASAQVNLDTNRWQCFACDLYENAIDLTARREGISVSSALALFQGDDERGGRNVRGRSGGRRRVSRAEVAETQLDLLSPGLRRRSSGA